MERNNKITLGVLSFVSLGALGYLYYESNTIETTYFQYKTERGKNVRILQLSDLHDKVFGKGNKRLLEKINEISPDLILLTGDTVSSGGKNLVRTCKFLKMLCSMYPVMGILGNHEQRKGAREFIETSFKKAGVKLLNNEICKVNINGSEIDILGLCEKQAVYRSDYLKALMGKLEHENHDDLLKQLQSMDGIRIVLSHFPENYSLTGKTAYGRFNFEMMMSGHGHGGHVRLPLIGGIYSAGQGIFPYYTKGLYKNKNNSLLVSAGLGNDSPIPRFNNPPSLQVVDFI